MTLALYPGTFDPVTNGHLDIANRSASLFDQLIIGIYQSPPKRLLFTIEERVDLMTRAVASLPNVQVRPYTGLTVTFARSLGAQAIVRGLRMSSDFEREFEMALMNKKLAPDLELVCLMASLEFQFLSSTLLKEVAELDTELKEFVPPHVAAALRRKFHTGG
ncbi:MAG: pantetheine-phosphate adenylyltransferase [Chloroflexi bacterium]|nr:pantetheine-phosphate adenylyltransferase [Chloroflexota bacterium]